MYKYKQVRHSNITFLFLYLKLVEKNLSSYTRTIPFTLNQVCLCSEGKF